MYSKILLPIDHSDQASWEKALPLALEEARSHGAELSVVSVIPEIMRLPNLPENYGEGAAAHVEGEIKGIVGPEIPVTVRQGSVYREILKEAHAIQADLILMASPKGDFPDYLLGPNAARVVRHANCSVLICRD
jgi:universal stress protein F